METQVARNEVCSECPETRLGRSKICMYCEYGGSPRSQLSPDGWKRVGELVIPVGSHAQAVPLVSDYLVTGFGISDWSRNPLPGSPVWVDVAGQVFDQYAGFPDSWRLALAAAPVDNIGIPLPYFPFYLKYFSSIGNGKKYPYDNIIIIADNVFDVPWKVHIPIGTMPNNPLKIWVQLFACHDLTTDWNTGFWSNTN